jgi:anhydro-N-acetylmuramic acid kinase
MVRHGREPLDRDGAEAAKGQVDEMALHSNATGAFLKRKPPKSLDRNEFALALDRMTDLSLPDGAATLTALTVECVAEALNHMPVPPARWLVCGGGRKNPVMMAMLAERLGAPVDSVDAVGFDGDMLEAQAFAYLAVRSLRGLPLSAPGTTACREPVTGGQLSHP